MDYVIAFVVGGAICALSQILMEKTKMLPGRIMVLLVCLGAVLGALGLYGPFSDWAKAGANVPLMGFGNNLWKGVKEMVDKEYARGRTTVMSDAELLEYFRTADEQTGDIEK